MNSEALKKALLNMAEVIEKNKEYLTELDAAIGDGDHGINMAKGFKIAAEKLEAQETKITGDLLKTLSMALISNVGGASGPLYGTFFMKAGAIAKDKEELGLSDFQNILKDGIDGIKMRGKAEKGEKTMLDVLIPVYESVSESISNNEEPRAALAACVQKAKEGVEYTKTIIATKGRASYVGERSIGHIDPGAMSSCLLLESLYNTLYA